METGYRELDRLTKGLKPSNLIIVAGRPGMGKTAFVSGFCDHIGGTLKKPLAFFSLQISKDELIQRMLCSRARVAIEKVRTSHLSNEEWPKVTRAAGELSVAPIYIDDTPRQTVKEFRAKAYRLKREHDIQMIAVDNLQALRISLRADGKQEGRAEISQVLKALACELNIFVVAVSQMSQVIGSRAGTRPTLSYLRDSGAIEQDADLVVFLFREWCYNPTVENRNKAEAIIAKHRTGPTGTVELLFWKDWVRFENPETDQT